MLLNGKEFKKMTTFIKFYGNGCGPTTPLKLTEYVWSFYDISYHMQTELRKKTKFNFYQNTQRAWKIFKGHKLLDAKGFF